MMMMMISTEKILKYFPNETDIYIVNNGDPRISKLKK